MDATSATLIAVNATGACGGIEAVRPGPGGGQSAAATAGVLVSSLNSSRMVNLAIDVYRTHPAAPQGCGCGRPACRSRLHAMKIFAAMVGGTSLPDHLYPLWGLLACKGCGLPLCPLESADGRRCYRSPCGCRMNLVEAATAERLTYGALDRCGLAPAKGVPESAWGALFARELAYVRVGAAPEDLVLVRHT
ncbi:hypothetical protein ACH4OY_02635 [Micromonospora rubida]|uniref:Post-SET domain-containing protein n=1 Tax=Micromonospora rubida TaxID=2697657 RepID=A0ABW7SF72_9ACTN